MNSKLIYFIVFIIIISTGALFFINRNISKPPVSPSLWANYEIITKTIEGKKLRLVVADNYERRQRGLMNVRKPVKNFDGMIFIFAKKEIQTFWNMNTFEDLTLYWMEDDIITGTSDLPSIEKSKEIIRVSSPKPVNIVVEVIQ